MANDTDAIGFAVRKCPFLHAVAEQQGTDFARSIAANPFRPANTACARRPIFEEENDFAATFRLFHGPQGVIPLARAPYAENVNAAHQSAEVSAVCSATASPPHITSSQTLATQLNRLPLASMSLPFFGNTPDWGKLFNLGKSNSARKRPGRQQPPSSSGDSTGGPKGRTSRGHPSRHQVKSNCLSTNNSLPSGGMPDPTPAPAEGACPLRKFLGPYAGLVFNARGHVVCPEAIVKARAALARTAPVRTLRPQALGIKLVAVGATAALLNVPAGMWREHMRKFSFGWFVAVHCTIPFVAMLRKAVVMPPAAIAFTIGAAVLGQALGARLERARLAQERGQLREQQAVATGAAPPTSTAADHEMYMYRNDGPAMMPLASVHQAHHVSAKGRRRATGACQPGAPAPWSPPGISIVGAPPIAA